MKRFFCTVCKKVKRVRRFPGNVVENSNSSPLPGHKFFGQCSWHDAESHSAYLHLNRKTHIVHKSSHKLAASAVKTRSKR